MTQFSINFEENYYFHKADLQRILTLAHFLKKVLGYWQQGNKGSYHVSAYQFTTLMQGTVFFIILACEHTQGNKQTRTDAKLH